MTHGPLIGKILLFAVPLMLSSVLQLLFNAADIIVVGQFGSAHSVAAVGSTVSLINLLISLFMGLAVGVNVLVAHYHAISRDKDVSETVHTAVVSGLIAGVILLAIGVALARPLLMAMDSPDDVVDLSALYLRIYFLGMPASLTYNIGAAILRAVGDTRRPLRYLSIAGVVNILLNLLFVIAFQMDVAGVALATILSQTVSALLVLRCLARAQESYRLDVKCLRIAPHKFRRILQIGLPAGLQGVVFSLSNVLIQSSINSFGAVAMSGNAAASNIEGFVYVAMNACYQACVTFTSANFGALDFKRVNRVLVDCLALVFVFGLVLGNAACFFERTLLPIYNSDPAAVQAGIERMHVICRVYFLCGMMDVLCGAIRGLGAAMTPMIVSTLGVCGLRIVWIYAIFSRPRFHTLHILYLSYPVTWLITGTLHLICFILIRNRAIAHAQALKEKSAS